jgi:hypothetical protein
MDARLFGQSHLNPVVEFRVLAPVPLESVHHCHQFAFLRPSKIFVKSASMNARLFPQSHSNLVVKFRLLANMPLDGVQYCHQFGFLSIFKR